MPVWSETGWRSHSSGAAWQGLALRVTVGTWGQLCQGRAMRRMLLPPWGPAPRVLLCAHLGTGSAEGGRALTMQTLFMALCFFFSPFF